MQVQLLKYSDKCFLSLANNLVSVGENCSSESIHKLRLRIKKIHALLKILDHIEVRKREYKIIKLIDQLYLLSGTLRDNQIQIELLKTYRSKIGEEVDRYIVSSKKEVTKIEEKLKHKIKKINHFEIVLHNQRIASAIEMLSSKQIDDILQTRVNELSLKLNQKINGILDDDILHSIRITLKELFYCISIIKRGKKQSKYGLSYMNSLENLQKKLGNWHDLKVLFDRIKSEPGNLSHIIEVDKQNTEQIVVGYLRELNELFSTEKRES